MTQPGFEAEVAAGQRFEFGKNWRSFLRVLDEARIDAAQQALARMLGVTSLAGRSFLDAGCGSGLSSLAAQRLGAERVLSFDYDPASVACARELKQRYFAGAARWQIVPGSVLDPAFLAGLGRFDVVYSWGVLHHTGQMWRALEAVAPLVGPGGTLFVSIYNDQGRTSRFWTRVKQVYNRGRLGKAAVLGSFIPYWALRGVLADTIAHRDPLHRHRFRGSRGMSTWHDWIDWLGGYPFEVAKPEQILDLYRARGFTLERMRTVAGGLGCNEFVLLRSAQNWK